jgi:hypothetical protein
MIHSRAVNDRRHADALQTFNEPLDRRLGAAPFGGVQFPKQMKRAHGTVSEAVSLQLNETR